MEQLPDTIALQKTLYNTAASGGASVVTINAASSDDNIVIDWVGWSYAGTPTSGALTIADATNSNTVFSVDITAGGPGEFGFAERGLRIAKNAQVTVTLADGSQTKKLTVGYR